MNNTPTKDPLQERIMEAIHKGNVHMKPRWRFMLATVLLAVGTLIMLLVLLYAASLSLFFLHENGVWFAPSFGARGWYALIRSIPVWHAIFILVCIMVLELLIHRYSFIYKRPLAGSFLAVAVLITAGAFLIAQTPFHRTMSGYARGHFLPPPFDMPYRKPFRIHRPPDVYEGTITRINNTGFTILYANDNDSDMDDSHGTSTSEVIVTPQTRLPYGADFRVGATVVVEGDSMGTDTVRAFGVREIDQ